MPLDTKDPLIGLALRASDFVDALDRQPLKITGLPRERYSLRIDSEPVGAFSRAELAAGVNLAILPTPMLKQALEVHTLTLRRNLVHYERWRHFQVPLQEHKLERLQPVLDSRDPFEAYVLGHHHAPAHPKPRHDELSPDQDH